jgi:DNA-binding CsgD family transcriptional regulator
MARISQTRKGANSHEEQLLAAIGAIYEAALTPQRWPDVLSRVMRLCGANAIIFSATALDPFEPKVTIQNAEGDPEQVRRMVERYTMPEHNPSIPILLASPVGRINLRAACFDDREWECTGLYQDTFRPFGLYDAFAVSLLNSPNYFVPMGIHRDKSRGRFDRESLAMFERLVPHLQRAMQLMLRLDTLGLHAATMQAAWDRLPYGILILDAGGRIRWSNRAGEAIIADNDSIGVRGLTLYAAAADIDAQLQRLIGESARIGLDDGLRSGEALQVPRKPPARPLSILVSPLRIHESASYLVPPSPAVMVLIVDPDHRRELPPAVLMRLFQLTRTEAALAIRIAAGTSLKQVADELAIAPTTARLHLQRVLRKTGTHRQSELVRLLLTVIPLGL